MTRKYQLFKCRIDILKKLNIQDVSLACFSSQALGIKGILNMSIESDRNRIAQIEREKSQIVSNLHREKENIKRKTTDINNIKRSVNKNTSQSMLQSKQRQIESKEKEILSCEKKLLI